MLFMEALVAWTAFLPGPFSFCRFPKNFKDYGQAYPAIQGQANTSALGQGEVALTPDHEILNDQNEAVTDI